MTILRTLVPHIHSHTHCNTSCTPLPYIYLSCIPKVRMVVVMPSDQWGAPGDTETGLLGADVAHGYLHGLPSECCNTTGISNVVTTRSVCSPFGYHTNDHATAAASASTTVVASSATAAANNGLSQQVSMTPPPLPHSCDCCVTCCKQTYSFFFRTS